MGKNLVLKMIYYDTTCMDFEKNKMHGKRIGNITLLGFTEKVNSDGTVHAEMRLAF